MNKRDFLEAYKKLLEEQMSRQINIGGVNLNGCDKCSHCNFCDKCEFCYHCSHCQECTACYHCTHCKSCVDCYNCKHLVNCENCHGSAYLENSVLCTDCNYCYGCVGLDRKEFHILNQPYSRREYFEIVKHLK